jgi:hypothetical protein
MSRYFVTWTRPDDGRAVKSGPFDEVKCEDGTLICRDFGDNVTYLYGMKGKKIIDLDGDDDGDET